MTEKIRQELEKLRELLRVEREEELEQYRKQVEGMPPAERRRKGYCWQPLQVVGQGYTIGDRAYVVVERTRDLEVEHRFRPGKTVRLYSEQAGGKRLERSGVVYWVHKKRMRIILNAEDLPDWLAMGALGVDLLFDETTYQEMEKALSTVLHARQGRLADLRDALLGATAPRFQEGAAPVAIPDLNDSQNGAVAEVLAAEDVAVIHGPPGTGKTTTLVQAVRLLCEREPTVLVTAPSNTAVDLLTERLAGEGLRVVRIGNISRVDERIINHTLEVQLAAHPESKDIKKIKVKAAEARRAARRYKRRFGREEYLDRQQLFQEARELSAWARQLEDRLIDQLLDGAQVITCTLVGAAAGILGKRRFRTVVIDEAAQALEPATWIPIVRASRVVLTGDPFQLPPTVKSTVAGRGGLSVALLEKCLQRLPRVRLLTVQYRMHEVIMNFSNEQFYGQRLQADASVAAARLPVAMNEPLVFIDTAGCGFVERTHAEYRSRYNPEEFHVLCEHLYQLLQAYQDGPPLPGLAIISPYREQVRYMEAAILEDPILRDIPLTVSTIDGFQGQENDVVYLSLVRSNERGAIGFLSDYRRMNVAMTRARRKLVVVGDSATIGAADFYRDFLEYCDRNGRYRSAWEFLRTPD